MDKQYHVVYVEDCTIKIASFEIKEEMDEFIYEMIPKISQENGTTIDLVFHGDILMNGYT